MRNTFAEEMTALAGEQPKLVLLSGDIGNKLFDNFKAAAPNRFYNCGVAEANMMGVAAGMALSGLRPVVYTITPFTTTRCYEQIRIDVCYHEAPVIIVGTGSGLSYAELGPTHHSLEDIAILRALPGMRVLTPCDRTELRLALRAALAEGGPTYIRIGKKGEPDIHTASPEFQLGRFIVVRPGNDVALIAAGTIMSEALAAADRLAAQGISAEVVSCHTVKPLDGTYLEAATRRFKLIATIEEHGLIGGLGSAVAESRADAGAPGRLLRFGTADEFMHEVGDQDYARRKYGLDAEAIAARIAVTLART
jgi:transketolase